MITWWAIPLILTLIALASVFNAICFRHRRDAYGDVIAFGWALITTAGAVVMWVAAGLLALLT